MDGYELIPMKDITDEARKLAVLWMECDDKNWIGQKHKLASDIMNYARKYHESEVKKLGLFSVTPRLFYVVAEIEEGVWEQITIGLETYKQAKDYKEGCDGKYPNAFIVASLNEG